MFNVKLKVDLFPGAHIENVAWDLCSLANKVGVIVEAIFNGDKIWARPGDNPIKLVDAFHNHLKKRHPAGIIQAKDAE